MVKSLFNSLSLRKECCNLKSTNELALLLALVWQIPASRATSTSRQFKGKARRTALYPSQPLLLLLRSSSRSNQLNDTVPRPSVHGCCFNLLYAIQICLFQSVDESCCFSPSAGASNGRLPKNKM